MAKIILTALFPLLICNSFGQEILKHNFAPKLGVCTSITNHELVAAAGFDYIEEGVQRFLIPDKPEEDFQKNLSVLKESTIPILACNGFLPGRLKTTGPNPQHEQILEYAEIAFRRANEAGIKRIVFGSSGSRNFPEGFEKTKAVQQFTELLRKMGPVAQKYDVIVVIEPLRQKESNIINRVDEAFYLALKVNHPNIQVLGDVYHMLRENEAPASLIQAKKMLKHMHLAEVEKRTAPGLMGDNFLPYLQALKISDYQGGISIEGSWGNKSDYEKNLIIARSYLQGQINALN